MGGGAVLDISVRYFLLCSSVHEVKTQKKTIASLSVAERRTRHYYSIITLHMLSTNYLQKLKLFQNKTGATSSRGQEDNYFYHFF